ncbi:MAG TPA: curli assembly protein CsgF [Paralcaligenes sp.]|jgi:curli production assembly/transport component CsgF
MKEETRPTTQIRQAFAALLMSAVCGGATASQIIYTPVNPAFGGNPFNGAVLLDKAQAQNKYTDPDLGSSALDAQTTPLQDFNNTLQRSILSRVAATASSQIIGNDGTLHPGTVETSDFTISVVDVGGGLLKITTTDKASGAQTSFQVGQ